MAPLRLRDGEANVAGLGNDVVARRATYSASLCFGRNHEARGCDVRTSTRAIWSVLCLFEHEAITESDDGVTGRRLDPECTRSVRGETVGVRVRVARGAHVAKDCQDRRPIAFGEGTNLGRTHHAIIAPLVDGQCGQVDRMTWRTNDAPGR